MKNSSRFWTSMVRVGLILFLGVAIVLILPWFISEERSAIGSQIQLEADISTEGFAKAFGDRPLVFPKDFGPHEDFQSEWWYYTGNLAADSGERFGYQLTFFRRALAPPKDRVARESNWAADQIYFAHFTITDVNGGNFQAFERFARGGAGLAGAQFSPYEVWLESWFVREEAEGEYRLFAAETDLELDLRMTDTKGPILQGEDGYSRKGSDEGAASYYYSQTNLATTGTVRIGDESYTVAGKSWKDHEFSTSALNDNQVGWDWFSIQLDDNTELMLFHIRREDGTIDPVSSGVFIEADGTARQLAREDFQILVEDTWTSPRSGATYPSGWDIRIPVLELELQIEPYVADQELNVSFVYWEGAVRVTGTKGGISVAGFGYTELTGYHESMAGVF